MKQQMNLYCLHLEIITDEKVFKKPKRIPVEVAGTTASPRLAPERFDRNLSAALIG